MSNRTVAFVITVVGILLLLTISTYNGVDAYRTQQQLERCQEAVELADEIIQHAGDGFEAVGRNDFRDVQDIANKINHVGSDYGDARAECEEED